ncbi:MAG: cytochrome c3 family protein [Anaerolineae bacterium]
MITSLIRQHPRLSLAIALMLLLLVVVVAAGIFALSRVYAMPAQPLPFQHSTHIQAGVECLFCHPGASSGPVAGIPSMTKCMGCHNNVQATDPKSQANIERVIEAWNSGQPVRWIKVNDQPDFVHFNHRPHIAAGVACETCHGDISSMGYARSYNLNMGFCLDCHRKQAEEKVVKLIDCGTCHY